MARVREEKLTGAEIQAANTAPGGRGARPTEPMVWSRDLIKTFAKTTKSGHMLALDPPKGMHRIGDPHHEGISPNRKLHHLDMNTVEAIRHIERPRTALEIERKLEPHAADLAMTVWGGDDELDAEPIVLARWFVVDGGRHLWALEAS